MKSLRPMSIGGFIVAGLIVVLQPFPDVQLVVVAAACIFGLVALVMLAIDAVLPHPAPQPVAQPVSQPANDPLQPYDLLAGDWSQPPQPAQPVADRWSQPLAQPVVVDSQPLATAPQPARRPADIMASMIFDEIPEVRHVPWLEQKVAPVAVDDEPDELPGTPEPALPLPRRAPTAAEYPLVWDAIQDAGSMNAAILTVYGSKDGKTHRWVARVAGFYRNAGPMPDGADVEGSLFQYELIGTCDMPGMVAARLGLEVDDEQLAYMMAGLDQCDDCSAWYSVSAGCACQQQEEVA